ncbi:MAG: tetratricopeptide repeat protein [Sphingobacteriaceae bacterium]|nr:tetratricopeptide repeat protein [Cytophagaceae bacterium]
MLFIRNFLTAFFVSCAPTVLAQDGKSDSLLRRLPQVRDTAKVNVLNQLSKQYWFADSGKTMRYAREAIGLAQTLDFKKGIALAYNNVAVGYYLRNDYANALRFYEKAVALNEELGNRKGVGDAFNNMGLVYWKLSNYSKAVAYYLRSLNIDEQRGDQAGVAASLDNIGTIYDEQGDYRAALTYYFRALKLEEKMPAGDINRGMTLNNIGTAYLHQKRYPDALAYFSRSLKERGTQDREGKAVCLSNIGLTHLSLKQYPQALHFLTEALRLQQALGDTDDLLSTLDGLSKAHQQTGDLSQSETYARQGLQAAQGVGEKKRIASAYHRLAELAAGQNQHREAYQLQVRYAQTRDSILNDETTRQIARLQASYEQEKKEAEFALLRQEAVTDRAVRNLIALGLLSSVVISVLIFSRQRLRARKNQQVYLARQAQAEAEIQTRQAKEQQLQVELDLRNKALTTHTLNLIQKNGILGEIRETVSLALKSHQRDENTPLYGRLIKLIDYSFNLDKDWDEFKLYFESVHTDFFVKLKETHADLSAGELRLCALIRLNLNLKETATLLGISPDSVKTARHRLRKKLALPEEHQLTGYLMTI